MGRRLPPSRICECEGGWASGPPEASGSHASPCRADRKPYLHWVCASPALAPAALSRRCPPADIPFESTAEAEELAGVLGQERAVEAVQLGIGIRREGYNLIAIGPAGIGKHTLLRQLLGPQAAAQPTPPDWCYVSGRPDPHKPHALQLPPGRGERLRADMERAVEELCVAMRAAFHSEEYRTRKQQLDARLRERQDAAMAAVRAHAKERQVSVERTEEGVILAPIRDGKAIDAAAFQQLPRPLQAELQVEMERVGGELQVLFGRFQEWEREHDEAVRALDREIAASVARRVIDGVRGGYAELPDVLEHLAAVERDIVESVDEILAEEEAEEDNDLEGALRHVLGHEQGHLPSLLRYRVNVVIDNGVGRGAPVVYEDNPTHANLVGRIEHVSRLGALFTDFTLIKPGALHRARGGYLLLDALKVLQSPFAWEALKRVVRSREIRIESLGELLGLVNTVSLEPEPIPLEGTKVVLLAERLLYYLLAELDPDFLELFKVLVDFEESIDRGPQTHGLYARLIAALVHKEGLRPLHRTAVARVIEQAARLAGDAEKLSVHLRPIMDLLREADFCAGAAGRAQAGAQDVEAALDAQQRRAGRIRERLFEEIRRETLLIATTGESVGQVNGLSVAQLAEHWFGFPTRITARVRMGKGEVIDIEREVEMGGPIHSKGVLILAGFLGARYATQAPLSLAASLVFEQSYGTVDGDSASLAEICALLSALSPTCRCGSRLRSPAR